MAGRFGLAKPGHPPKFPPFCLFLEGTFKIVIDIAKKKVQTFLNSAMFRGVLWTPSYINSPRCLNFFLPVLSPQALVHVSSIQTPHLHCLCHIQLLQQCHSLKPKNNFEIIIVSIIKRL